MAESDFILCGANVELPTISARIFPQDPLVAEHNSRLGDQKIKLSGEACLGSGPTSSRIGVVDYNADLDSVFEPASVRKDRKGFSIGRRKPVDNFKFHQVNVWAVITHVLNMVEDERVIGRRIPWAFERGRLLVLPHAGYWANAFYDRSTGALHFFYFEDQKGKPVYTCLSHDIVAHELGHAILDGLKPYYNEVSSPATAGFHEYFGDAIAMAAALSHRVIIVEVAGRGHGELDSANVIANIATQFGSAVSKESYGHLADVYLRTGLNTKTMADLEGVVEEHQYSEVLTGAYYDLLRAFYDQMLKDEIASGKKYNGGLRVRVLMNSASLVARLLLRAIDYCPPVDINYQDYARAVVRADQVAYPLDPAGYRRIAVEVFKNRGIIDQDEEQIGKRWRKVRNDELRDLDVEVIGASATDAYRFIDANRKVLSISPLANFRVVHAYRTRKISADGYRPPRETIVEFVWPERIPLSGREYGEFNGTETSLWCGGTLVFDHDGNLLYYIIKQDTPERRKTLREYIAYLVRMGFFSLDDGEQGIGARSRGSNLLSGKLIDGQLVMTRAAAFRHGSGMGR